MDKQEKLKRVLLYSYAGIMCFLLLDYIWLLLVYDGSGSVPDWIWLGRCAAALLGIWLSRNWKDPVFQLLALFAVLLCTRALLRRGNTPEDYQSILRLTANGVWAWGGCYSLGKVLKKDQFKAFFKIFGSAWTVGMAGCALCGLYAAWMRVQIPNISGEGFFRLWGEANKARLNLVFLSTVSGGLMAMSVIIAAICLLCFQKKWVQCLFVAAVLPMLLALTLTDSRNAQICVSAGTAALAGICLLDREQKRLSIFSYLEPPEHTLLTALAGAAMTFIAMLLLLRLVNPAFDQLKRVSLHWPFFRSGAMAGTEQIMTSNRGYFGEHVTTGRVEVWRAVLSYLWHNPKYLLIGKSFLDPMAEVNAQLSEVYQASHCHNILLQVLLASGLPGLLLLCAVIYLIGKQTVRLAISGNLPLWQRAFAAIAVVIGTGELAECLTSLGFHYLPFLPVLNLAAGFIGSETDGKSRASFRVWRKQLRDKTKGIIKRASAGLPRAARAMKPMLLLAVFLFAFIPTKYDAGSYHTVIHQDDYDDPEKDLYYFCGNSECETHHGCHTIKTSGCGLCAIVNAVAYMMGETIDVHEVAAFARENEHYAVHIGSKMSLYQAFAEAYGEKYNFSYVARVETLAEATRYLEQGCVVIAGVGNNRGGGHILVLAGYNAVTKQYTILDSAGNYSGWSHDFYSCQTIENNHLETNPNVFLTSFLVYFSPAAPYRDI